MPKDRAFRPMPIIWTLSSALVCACTVNTESNESSDAGHERTPTVTEDNTIARIDDAGSVSSAYGDASPPAGSSSNAIAPFQNDAGHGDTSLNPDTTLDAQPPRPLEDAPDSSPGTQSSNWNDAEVLPVASDSGDTGLTSDNIDASDADTRQPWLTNDSIEWSDAVPASITTIDFDNQPSGILNPSSFNEDPGAPVFELVSGEAVVIAEAYATYQQIVTAPSGTKYLIPVEVSNQQEPAEGIIRVTFTKPIIALSATFIDVEADFATTGFSASGELVPTFAFMSQPTGSFAFLGVLLAEPTTYVDIHFATGASIDGVGLDDFQYVLAPE